MKARNIISIVLNGIAVIASLIGLIIIKDSGAIVYAKYFTVITNSFIVISGLVSIGYSVEFLLKKDKESHLPIVCYVLKLATAVSALLTFLTVVCYLQYAVPELRTAPVTSILFWNNILHHYVGPLSFILGFILFDTNRKYNFKLSFLGIIFLFIYMAYMVPFCLIKNGAFIQAAPFNGAPYPFLDVTKIPAWVIILCVPVFLVIGVGLSIVLWTLNRIFFLIFTGDEISKEEIDGQDEDESPEIVVSKEEIAEVEEINKSGYKGPRIYHISKREDKMWQVKYATGKKAIKLFPTQAEAIVYAKKLAKSQGGSIRVHSVKGRIRKSR